MAAVMLPRVWQNWAECSALQVHWVCAACA
jgi:hypothetical protein